MVVRKSLNLLTIGPNEVLVKVGACGIKNTDIWVREDAYGNTDDTDAVASFKDWAGMIDIYYKTFHSTWASRVKIIKTYFGKYELDLWRIKL
jgi:hypothetical protein